MTTEIVIRLIFFFGVFALIAALEAKFPRRQRDISRLKRWPANIGISFLNQGVVKLLIPVTAVSAAIYAESNSIGLFHVVPLPLLLVIPLSVLLLDLVIYWQHRVFHLNPLLWRLHRMHHADLNFDVSTGIRFHPISILLSVLIKLAAVMLIGAPAIAVLIFEVLLNATSVFNHSNLKFPTSVDRILRYVIVTPDMHRLHHSSTVAETNSNFGFNFPWWDRLFRSYRDQPALGHEQMQIGLAEFRDEDELLITKMLTQPFRTPTESH